MIMTIFAFVFFKSEKYMELFSLAAYMLLISQFYMLVFVYHKWFFLQNGSFG